MSQESCHLSADTRSRQSLLDMHQISLLPQATVLEHTLPLAAETVPLAAALGRTLAADVVARDPLPPFPASMMVRKQ